MPPPIRRTEDDYHFHTYDFLNAQAWQATTVPNHGDFYSLVADLEGLRAFGVQNGVPNIDLDYGPPIDTGGRRLMTLRFGNPQQPAVLITGGIHAREWIAPEMVYLLAEYLVANYTTAVATPYQRELRQIVDSRWIHITPMLNPNGNHFTVFQDSDLAAKCLPRQWRKNLRTLPTDQDEWEAALTTNGEANPPFKNVTIDDGNECSYDVPDYDGVRGIPPGKPRLRTITPAEDQTGVDLARNFSTQAWGYDANPDDKEKTSSQSRSESYFGPAARSEAETAYVESYVDRLYNLRTSIDYHAYGQYIVYPSEAHHRDLIDGGYRQLGVVLGALIGPPAYTLGTPKSTMGTTPRVRPPTTSTNREGRARSSSSSARRSRPYRTRARASSSRRTGSARSSRPTSAARSPSSPPPARAPRRVVRGSRTSSGAGTSRDAATGSRHECA